MKKARILVGLSLVLVLGAVAFAARARIPHLVDITMNRVVARPALATDGDRARVATMHVVDLHADPLMWNRDLLQRADHGHVDVPRLIEGHVTLQVLATPTLVPATINMHLNPRFPSFSGVVATLHGWPAEAARSPLGRALTMAHLLRDAVTRSNGTLRFIRTRADLLQHLADVRAGQRVTAALLATEGAYPLESGLEAVATLRDAGFRMVGLAHFVDGDIAGSAHGLSGHGLTELGRAMVPALEEAGITVDLAHASPATFSDTLAIARRPVVVSHTGVQGTCSGPRNLSDEQLGAVAQNGGVVGIGFFDGAVCDTSMDAIVAAIRYAISVVGVAHVGLGSDWDGAVSTPLDVTGTAELVHALRDAGMDDDALAAVMGGNALRVLMANLPPG